MKQIILNQLKFSALGISAILVLILYSFAYADENILAKVRVSYRPDGGVSITSFLNGACGNNETETQCMDRIFATNPIKDFPYDDILIDQIPKDRANRDEDVDRLERLQELVLCGGIDPAHVSPPARIVAGRSAVAGGRQSDAE